VKIKDFFEKNYLITCKTEILAQKNTKFHKKFVKR